MSAVYSLSEYATHDVGIISLVLGERAKILSADVNTELLYKELARYVLRQRVAQLQVLETDKGTVLDKAVGSLGVVGSAGVHARILVAGIVPCPGPHVRRDVVHLELITADQNRIVNLITVTRGPQHIEIQSLPAG